MNRWSEIAAFIASLIAIYLFFDSSIDKKIDQKLNEPKFIKEVGDKVRLPFLIFDDNKIYTADTGAKKYIKNIDIKRSDKFVISEIVISPNSFLAVPPILESIDDKDIGFEAAKRGKEFDLIYKTVDLSSQWMSERNPNSQPQRRFRLQMVVIPDE